MLNHFLLGQLFVTPWTRARQAPPSTGFSRQEYWNGLPCPPSGDLPKQDLLIWSSLIQTPLNSLLTGLLTIIFPSLWPILYRSRKCKNINLIISLLCSSSFHAIFFFYKTLTLTSATRSWITWQIFYSFTSPQLSWLFLQFPQSSFSPKAFASAVLPTVFVLVCLESPINPLVLGSGVVSSREV